MPGPRVVIVGGGIGGLACAAFLRRAGLTATVDPHDPLVPGFILSNASYIEES